MAARPQQQRRAGGISVMGLVGLVGRMGLEPMTRGL
jgi:hypothetical protein